MSLRPTKQLSEKATVELLEEFSKPTCTPQMKAQQEKVIAMASKMQKKAEAKSRPMATSK
jgi:hypothetical protein